MMPQDTPATCEGFGKKFSIKHALSCPKGGLVLTRHDEAANEWGALGARPLVTIAITYKTKTNSRIVQGERTGAGARQEGGAADGGTETIEEAQGGRGRTVNVADRLVGRPVNGAARLAGQPGQVVVPAELREYVSTHGFWKRGTTTMFDIRIVNLYTGSYLRMTPEKALAKTEKENKDLYLQA